MLKGLFRRFSRAHVERYSTHAVICYRGKSAGATWCGIEFEGDEHTWDSHVLQSAAATRLGLSAEEAGHTEVIDLTTGCVPDGFYN